MAFCESGRVPSNPERSPREELLRAAVGVLDEHGPDALQARKVAAAAATSTMSVYTHFGGMQGLIDAVADEGRRQLDAALTIAESADPVADLLTAGGAYRQFALARPHMYRLMFGSTSARGIDAAGRNLLTMTDAEIGEMYAAFGQLLRHVRRCIEAGRFTGGSGDDQTAAVTAASQLWSMTHGFVMLELAGYYGDDGSAAIPVLGAMAANFFLALGDSPDKLMASLSASGWL